MSRSCLVLGYSYLLFGLACGLLIGCADTGKDGDDDDAVSDDDAIPDDDAVADDDAASDDDATPDDDQFGGNDEMITLPMRMQAIADEYVAFSGDPGFALGLWQLAGEMQSYVAGMADLIKQVPMQPGLRFRVGSSTKPFVTAVVLQLVEEGALALDDPLTKYLPQYPQWSEVTIRHLLRMQSGIADYLMNDLFWLRALLLRFIPLQPEDIMAFVANAPMDFAPGTQCSYGSTNFILLGMIIEAVTGHSAQAEIDERVIVPLGLEKTYLDMHNLYQPDLVRGYADILLAGAAFGLSGDLMAIAALIPDRLMLTDTLFDGTYLFHPSSFYTAGALVSDSNDLLRFMQAFIDGELFGPDSMDVIMEFQTCEEFGETIDYSAGTMRLDTPYGYAYGHGGKHFGYSTDTYYIPDVGLLFTFLHDFVPDQNVGMMDEVWRVAMGDLPRPPRACLAPEGFFPKANDDYLHLRFKGALNEADAETPIPAIGLSVVWSDGTPVFFYGVGAVAELQAESGTEDNSAHLETIGPNDEEEFHQRVVAFDLLQAAVATAADNYIEVSADVLGPLFVTLLDVEVDADTSEPVKRCVTGVPDLARPSQLFLCEAEEVTFEAGSFIKLYGRLAVETKPKAVADYLESQDRSVCECADEEGNWTPC